ncbi:MULTISPECIES: AmmeMemoRadiSam system protein B [Proteiniphilum]|jgi:AmmeMemoRadiSam system protein B|uniref:AmmeMemoRadiSam system protein B n=1 Tax=Proteiniphilum TaxID=294702 RepID=UPI001EECE11F|nr:MULTISPECIES: AmmeMemoRadiSam system protein B [Proteiniphilum]ULB35867.1 AmmeMemoRadiSam system protein B [Proteiniphilum propionicum]
MKNISTDRKPAVAGQFYPVNADMLQEEVGSYFRAAVEKKQHHVRAIICPHAGYTAFRCSHYLHPSATYVIKECYVIHNEPQSISREKSEM